LTVSRRDGKEEEDNQTIGDGPRRILLPAHASREESFSTYHAIISANGGKKVNARALWRLVKAHISTFLRTSLLPIHPSNKLTLSARQIHVIFARPLLPIGTFLRLAGGWRRERPSSYLSVEGVGGDFPLSTSAERLKVAFSSSRKGDEEGGQRGGEGLASCDNLPSGTSALHSRFTLERNQRALGEG